MNAISTIATPSTALVPHNMDEAIRLSQAMSSSRMVPKHLQDDVGTCLMIVEQAMRWRMSPFAVAQCTSSIGGKLMFEGKLVAAAVEASGAIEGGFDYAFEGEGDSRKVVVSAKRVGETNPRQLTVHLKDARTNNEHWKKQPDQQLVYHSTRAWARRWTPSVILGVYAPEEFDRKRGVPFDGPTIEAETETETPEPKKVAPDAGGNGEPHAKPARRFSELLEGIDIHLAGVQSLDDYNAVVQSPDAVAIMERGNQRQRDALEEHLKPVRAKFMPQQATMPLASTDPWDRETGEITPADRLASG